MNASAGRIDLCGGPHVAPGRKLPTPELRYCGSISYAIAGLLATGDVKLPHPRNIKIIIRLRKFFLRLRS